MKFSVFQLSRKGGRAKNEDRMGYCYTRGAVLLLLADGMGGHPQGEVAAQLTLQVMVAMFQKEAQPELPDAPAFLGAAAMAAHHRILRHAIETRMPDTPRTTIVAAVVQGGSVSWIHCGDSRFYLVRHGKLLMRTRDHSFAERRESDADKGKLHARINRNILFSCLGSPIKPALNLAGPFTLQQGDRLMLCSDGLWHSLSDVDIVQELDHAPVHEAVPELVRRALIQGGAGSDNVTVIALEWETPDDFESTRDRISTDSIGAGNFASTFQGHWPDPELDDLDDAAIERSITEINEAIRRSTVRKA